MNTEKVMLEIKTVEGQSLLELQDSGQACAGRFCHSDW